MAAVIPMPNRCQVISNHCADSNMMLVRLLKATRLWGLTEKNVPIKFEKMEGRMEQMGVIAIGPTLCCAGHWWFAGNDMSNLLQISDEKKINVATFNYASSYWQMMLINNIHQKLKNSSVINTTSSHLQIFNRKRQQGCIVLRIIETLMQNDLLNTVRCCYSVVNFLHNIHERHPIAHPSGWGMGCLLWVQPLIDVWRMSYGVSFVGARSDWCSA